MIKKLIIVGGGTAGLIAAMILKTRLPLLEIEIIKSKGDSSTREKPQG